MSLRFAILTALSEKSSSGIELARRFDRSIGYFWPASHQQIYRELDTLLGDGLIEQLDDGTPPSRGNPRTFRVTADGTAALRAWAGRLEDRPKVRDALMVRIRAAAALSDVDPRAALRHRLAIHERTLEAYEAIDARQFTGPLDRSARLQRQVLRAGIASERMWVAWCRDALAELDRAES